MSGIIIDMLPSTRFQLDFSISAESTVTTIVPSSVAAPVSPDTVIFDPAQRSQSALSVMSMEFADDTSGLLCPISRRVKDGTKIRRGFDPLLMFSRFCPEVVIAAAVINAPDGNDAATETIGAF